MIKNTHIPNKTEIYGFLGWLLSFICVRFIQLFMYFVWFLLPDEALISIGIVYYPKKYWGVAIPAFICMSVIFIQIIYQGLNQIYAHPITSMCTIQDLYSRRLQVEPKDFQGIPEISDIPANVITEILYSEKLKGN